MMSAMADTWRSIGVNDVQPGDRIRHREVWFIEDTPTRWHAHPAARSQEVEITGR